MAITIDPAGKEIRALKRATAWKRKRLLEIGCGEGRLSLRLAALGPKQIEALDPDDDRIRRARAQLPARLESRIRYHVGHAERLKYPPGAFDIVVFSWAL